MTDLTSLIIENYIEVIAASLGLIAIYLQIRQKVIYWPVSIVLVSLYIAVYIEAKLYADMSLQVYYLVISFYGWYYWMFGKKKQEKKVPVTRASKKTLFWSLIAAIAFFIGISQILVYLTDSDVPYLDAFTTALSFVATWMLTRKIIENWLIWIVVDAVSSGLYIYKGLYPTTVLFIVLTVLAVVGYRQWMKDEIKNRIANH